jgi:hypothetical protein
MKLVVCIEPEVVLINFVLLSGLHLAGREHRSWKSSSRRIQGETLVVCGYTASLSSQPWSFSFQRLNGATGNRRLNIYPTD